MKFLARHVRRGQLRFTALALCALAPLTPARAAEQQTRAQVVRRILPKSVRIQVLSGGQVKRTATGVVVRSQPGQEGGRPRSTVLTNAHVVDPAALHDVTYRVLIERRGRVESTLDARLAGMGAVPDLDLALLDVDALLPAAELGTEEGIDVGDEVVVVGAPYGRALSVSGGMVSQLEAVDAPAEAPIRFKAMKTDAAIGYGSSGGGVFTVPGGRLVGIVEGYRTARVAIDASNSFDVPMPGETFVAPITKLRGFLAQHPSAPAPAATTTAALEPPASAPHSGPAASAQLHPQADILQQ